MNPKKTEAAKDAAVLAAAKRFVKAYIKYGKELEVETEALANTAMKRWPELRRLGSE